MTFYLFSLGCKVNEYETNAVRELMFLNNFIEGNKDSFDIAIVNTCAVTATADQKSRQHIRKFRNANKNAIIVVMGCYSQNHGEEVIARGDADIVIGVNHRKEIPELIKSYLLDKKPICLIDSKQSLRSPNCTYEHFNVISFTHHTRAYVKIQDGCDNFCSYCIIPSTRGRVRSRDKDDILKEIKSLVDKGYQEIVLAGIHTGGYGLDLKDYTFSDLLEDILKNTPNLYRLRISSIEESELDDKFISLLKDERIANHLHMPLQSGSSSVLKRMHRKYNVDDFINKVNRIREIRKDISITTDIITGFILESEDEFNETYEFIKKVGFAELHIFPFSKREGTIAYKYVDIDPAIKKERVKKLLALNEELKSNYQKQFYGQEMDVLFEDEIEANTYRGHTSNYLEVVSKSNYDLRGRIVKIKLDSTNIK